MKLAMKAPSRFRSRGFVSLITMLFLVAVVMFLLMRSLDLTSSKNLETQEYFNGLAAMAQAEKGRERAMAGLTNALNEDDSSANFQTNCALYTSGSPVPNTGTRSYQYLTSPTPITGSLCPLRVRGRHDNSYRTFESQFNFSSVIGVGEYGKNITMTLRNPYSVPAVAVFNLAWRRLGSTGAVSPSGSQADGSCTTATCNVTWNQESSSGLPSVGTLGVTDRVGASGSVPVTTALTTERNYAQVGLMMGGYGTLPTYIGSYADSKETANTQNQAATTGTTTSGESKGWCQGADTLIFGVSGRGNDNPAAAYSSVTFNTAGSPAQPISMTWVSHFPNVDGSSPGTYGDVFSEIWYTYNAYFRVTGASSVGATAFVQVPSTAGIQVGTIIKVYSGTGQFPAFTRVKAITSATRFEATNAPTTPLSGATVCGGICALFDQPSSSASRTTTFTLTRASTAAQQWAGGFACYSGVDPAKIRRVSSSNLRIQKWHELLNNE